jgi:hypothetical protein
MDHELLSYPYLEVKYLALNAIRPTKYWAANEYLLLPLSIRQAPNHTNIHSVQQHVQNMSYSTNTCPVTKQPGIHSFNNMSSNQAIRNSFIQHVQLPNKQAFIQHVQPVTKQSHIHLFIHSTTCPASQPLSIQSFKPRVQ